MARVNGKEMPREMLCLPKEERLGDLRDLFSSFKMAHKTLGIWYMWFAVSFTNWSIAFITPFVGGSVYINLLISSISGLPAYPICAVLTMRFSRRKLLLVSFLLAALGAIGALLLSDKAKHDTGYLAGKIFMTMALAKFSSVSAFTLVYIYAAELFPTTLRNVAMGTSTAWARVSGFASAYAPLLFEVHRFLPFGIMAGLALGAAMLCMTLPETHNQPTLENLSHGPDENKNENNDEDENTTFM